MKCPLLLQPQFSPLRDSRFLEQRGHCHSRGGPYRHIFGRAQRAAGHSIDDPTLGQLQHPVCTENLNPNVLVMQACPCRKLSADVLVMQSAKN